MIYHLYLLWTTPASVSIRRLLSPLGPAPVALITNHNLVSIIILRHSLLKLILADRDLALVEGAVVILLLPGPDWSDVIMKASDWSDVIMKASDWSIYLVSRVPRVL